jgi:hypothetical protein
LPRLCAGDRVGAPLIELFGAYLEQFINSQEPTVSRRISNRAGWWRGHRRPTVSRSCGLCIGLEPEPLPHSLRGEPFDQLLRAGLEVCLIPVCAGEVCAGEVRVLDHHALDLCAPEVSA